MRNFVKVVLLLSGITTSSASAVAGTADGSMVMCLGDGIKVTVTTTGAHTAVMLLAGVESAFPVDYEEAEGKRVYRLQQDGKSMFVIINPVDGIGFVSRLDSSSQKLPLTCHNAL